MARWGLSLGLLSDCEALLAGPEPPSLFVQGSFEAIIFSFELLNGIEVGNQDSMGIEP